MKDHPLAIAARELNNYAEEHGLEAACEFAGLKIEDVKYMAEQRALRAIWAYKGINLKGTEPVALLLSSDEKVLFRQLVPAYMDGLVTGWLGKMREQQTKETKHGKETVQNH